MRFYRERRVPPCQVIGHSGQELASMHAQEGVGQRGGVDVRIPALHVFLWVLQRHNLHREVELVKVAGE